LKRTGRGWSVIKQLKSKLSDENIYDIITTLENKFPQEKVINFISKMFSISSKKETIKFIEDIKAKFEYKGKEK